MKPARNIRIPVNPKKCIGFFPKVLRNQSDRRSRKPLTKRSIPNLLFPYFLFWWCTGFSVILSYPAFFRQIRDVPVHLAIDFYILDNLVLVGFQSAVHVMQTDSGNPACCGIVKFGREILGQFVVLPVLFPARNDIPSVFCHHPEHLGYFFRRVLEVCVSGILVWQNYHVKCTLCRVKWLWGIVNVIQMWPIMEIYNMSGKKWPTTI